MRIDTGNLPSKQGKENNFTGKINNLATSDASEVAELADFWIVLLCFPFDLGLCLWFLYGILGYGAFLGFAFMLVSVPQSRMCFQTHNGWSSVFRYQDISPNFCAGYRSQKNRKYVVDVFWNWFSSQDFPKTDARVQSVTEGELAYYRVVKFWFIISALGVIRMGKLFGWEMRLKTQIASKRADELSYVKKSKLYGLLNTHTKWSLVNVPINLWLTGLLPVCWYRCALWWSPTPSMYVNVKNCIIFVLQTNTPVRLLSWKRI